jgi:hypothetical protein
MNERELKDLIRATVQQRLRALTTAARPAPPVHISAHASQDLYLTLVNVGDACLIEPGVPCNHCNYCKSHGH